ncbi:MAG TPA: hypothetical protein VH796_18405 [Nitrososphaeraceae archaeon]
MITNDSTGFIPQIWLISFIVNMNPLNRQETENLIVDLYYKQKKTFREIQRIVRKSPRDIKVILNKVEPERSSLSIPAQAYKLYSEGKTSINVAIILNIREPEATQFNLEYWKLNQLDSLNRIYQETNGNILPLVELHKQMKGAGMTVQHVIKLLLLANNDIQSIEQKCQDLKREEAAITAKNLNAAGTFQQLSNDISEISKVLDKYRSSCKGERIELARLSLQKEKLESLVRHFQNNSKDFGRIKELVKQAVEQSLTNHRHVLSLALLSVIDSCRRDPLKFDILYHNMPTTATPEMRLAEFDQLYPYNYGSCTNEQLCYQHENANDSAYWRFLIDEAEQFFNERLDELKHLCINRLADMFATASVPSNLTKNSDLDPEIVTSMKLYENKNIPSAHMSG